MKLLIIVILISSPFYFYYIKYLYNEATLPHNSHEPIFKHYFPQNTFKGEIPILNNRKTYFYHKIGDKLLIFSLDVGYEATMEGEQKDIMDDVLSKSKSKIKMAQFHGPIYAAWGQDSYFDYVAIRKGLEHWVPLFDKHNMAIIFENHTHAFKRSKKLKNGVPNENGTIYLGEGNWGVTKPGGVCDPSNVEIHDKVSLDQHVWIVTISNSNITATAYTNTFTVIDSIVITYH